MRRATYDDTYGEAPAGNYENIASYAFRNGTKGYSVFVLNRNITTDRSVTITLPLGTTIDSAKVYKLTGDPTGSNIDALNYTIQKQNLPAWTTRNYTFTMPKGSIYLFNINNASTVSTENITVDSDIKILSNPTSDLVYITMENAESATFSLRNLAGQELETGTLRNTISLAQYPAGVYFLGIKKQTKAIQYFKVIKQ